MAAELFPSSHHDATCSSELVIPDMAEQTTIQSVLVLTMSAAIFILDALPREVPPNFNTFMRNYIVNCIIILRYSIVPRKNNTYDFGSAKEKLFTDTVK
jgi:hypothetical protein